MDYSWRDIALVCVRFGRHAYYLAGLPSNSATLRILGLIERIGPMRVTDIAELEKCTQATASNLVARLRKEGLIRPDADPQDKRAQLLYLTQEGAARLERFRTKLAEGLEVEANVVTPAEKEIVDAAMPILLRLVREGPRERKRH